MAKIKCSDILHKFIINWILCDVVVWVWLGMSNGWTKNVLNGDGHRSTYDIGYVMNCHCIHIWDTIDIKVLWEVSYLIVDVWDVD